MKKYRLFLFYSLFIILFTIYALFDTFLIQHAYRKTAEKPTSLQKPTQYIQEEDYYQDENIEITLSDYRIDNSDIYVVDIKLADFTLFKTALAKNTYGRNITDTVATIAQENQAILAINGDFYGARINGYVIREGVIYRDIAGGLNQEDLIINKDGSWSEVKERQTALADIYNDQVLDVFSFGPFLIKDSKIVVDKDNNTAQGVTPNPRTIIARYDNLHYAIIIIDGRTSTNTGFTLIQAATFLHDVLKVKDAYNLDGGGSTTLYFNQQVINQPSTNNDIISQRAVSDIIYIGY